MFRRATHAVAMISVVALLLGLWRAGRRGSVVDAPAADTGVAWSPRSDGSQQPCPPSLPWRVARIDPRFGIGRVAAEAAVEGAGSLWEAAAGRRLFARDSVRGLPIRFTYDERQAEGIARRAAERALRASLDSLDARRRALDASAQDTAEARDEIERLEREREERQRDFRERFGAMEGEAARYAEAVRAEGERIVAVDREIRVYRFDRTSDLERILAHELGHALGLGHTSAQGAIMSERFELDAPMSGPSSLHPADVALLQGTCPEWFDPAAGPAPPTGDPAGAD